MPRTTRRLATLAIAGLVLLLAGCSFRPRERKLPETGATLEGTVTYGKEKIAVAMIIAQGKDGSSTAFVGDDGHYKLDNVPLGEVNLAVNTDAGKGNLTGRMMAQSQGKGTAPPPKVIDVPRKYADPTTSGIKTTIHKGANTFDIVVP